MLKFFIATLVIFLAATAAVAAYVIYDGAPSIARTTPICSGPADAFQRVLVIGDSWVSGGKIDGAMGATARVCSVSYSGKTSAEVLASLKADSAARNAVFADLIHVTDAVILVGVNDAVQQRGTNYYRSGLKRLIAYASTASNRVFVVELPWTNAAAARLSVPSAAKAALYSCLFDGCNREITAAYRASADLGGATLIDYDQFAPTFGVGDFMPDGVHLTEGRFANLGQVIAKVVTGN